MDHNFAIRHMVAQLRDAMPDVGWKKFTKLVSAEICLRRRGQSPCI